MPATQCATARQSDGARKESPLHIVARRALRYIHRDADESISRHSRAYSIEAYSDDLDLLAARLREHGLSPIEAETLVTRFLFRSIPDNYTDLRRNFFKWIRGEAK